MNTFSKIKKFHLRISDWIQEKCGGGNEDDREKRIEAAKWLDLNERRNKSLNSYYTQIINERYSGKKRNRNNH